MVKRRLHARELLKHQDAGFELLLIGLLICSVVGILAHYWKARMSWPAAASIGLYPLSILIFLSAGSAVACDRMRRELKGADWKRISPEWHKRVKLRLMIGRFTIPFLYLGLIGLYIATCRWICVPEPGMMAQASFAVGVTLAFGLIVRLATVSYHEQPLSDEEGIRLDYEHSSKGKAFEEQDHDASGITLPLWNKEETDVLPEYQLTSGHAICQAPMSPEDVQRLAKFLELGDLQYSGDLDAGRLPVLSGHMTLGTEQEAHLLIVEVGGHRVIFGPHGLFGNSTHWIEWNKKVGGLMAYTTQLDVEDYYHIVFGDGKRILSACAEGDSIRYLEDTPIEVFLGGKRIFHDPGSKPDPTNEIDALLNSDARISDKDGVIAIETFATHQPVEDASHYVFRL